MATTGYGSTYVSGTDLVANYPAASLLVAQGIDSAGYYIGRGINAQVASYVTVLTDAGKTITMTAAGANTVTIPANSSVAYVIGTRINILNLGAGACTPTAAAGVTINGTITALATNSSAAVIKTATNTWSYVPFGSGGAATLTSGDVTSTTGSPTITTSGIYTIYQFTGSGTIVLGKAGLCDVLVIGGGGGGYRESSAPAGAGGGGAGGYLPITDAFLASGTNTITIAAGGAAATGNFIGQPGATTRLGSYFVTGGAGGGGPAGNSANGMVGGSGSGAGHTTITAGTGGAGTGGLGNNGGNGGGSGATTSGGGGGGATAVGSNGSLGTGGAGGAGTASSITGSSVTRGGGGGGGGNTAGGAGGAGGGGAGSSPNNNAVAGGVNLGGGGGGCTGTGTAGAGGSGVVIVRVVT